MVTQPIDGQPATHGNGATIGFAFDSPEEVDAWHQRGVAAGGTAIEDPPGLRSNAFGVALPRLSARSRRQQVVRAAPPGAVTLETVSEVASHGGVQGVYRHASAATGTDMVFSLFMPPQAERGEPLPVLWYLSGLTCTHANVTEKGEYRAACAEAGMIFVAPDTSPRGTDVPDDPEGACGFRARARASTSTRRRRRGTAITTWRPTSPRNCRRWSPTISRSTATRQGICGHSMGGHGALTLALKHPGPLSLGVGLRADRRAGPGAVGRRRRWATISATDGPAWRAHDSVALIEDGARLDELLVDIGEADPFLDKELRPELLEAACRDAGIPLTLRRHAGLRPQLLLHLDLHGRPCPLARRAPVAPPAPRLG